MSETHRLGRRDVLAGIAGASVAAGGLAVGTLATFSDTKHDSGSLTSGQWGNRVAYTDGGTLQSVTRSDGITGYNTSGVDVLGPVAAGFSGSRHHIPIVDGSGNLVLVAADGTENALDTSGTQPPLASKSILATAAWNGHPLSVYYPGNNASKLLRIAPDGTNELIAEPENGVKATLGAGDINGDGTPEFVFVDGSGTIRYIVPASESTTRDIKSTSISPGSNNNFGAGPPALVDGYGDVVPAINGSGGVGLIDAGGWAEKSLTAGSTAAKTATTARDFDGDGALEIVFVSYADKYLKYLDDVGGTNSVETITDGSGSEIPADTARGVL